MSHQRFQILVEQTLDVLLQRVALDGLEAALADLLAELLEGGAAHGRVGQAGASEPAGECATDALLLISRERRVAEHDSSAWLRLDRLLLFGRLVLRLRSLVLLELIVRFLQLSSQTAQRSRAHLVMRFKMVPNTSCARRRFPFELGTALLFLVLRRPTR